MGMLRSVKRPQVVCGKSRTQQHVADLSSPRRLIEKYGSKRLKAALSAIPSLYSDVPLPKDYKESMDIITRGQQSFAALPSRLRHRFENDPYKLLEFLNDSNNRAEAVELGLISPAVTEEAKRPEVKKVDETANKADKSAVK